MGAVAKDNRIVAAIVGAHRVTSAVAKDNCIEVPIVGADEVIDLTLFKMTDWPSVSE
jgi:hypothetical protein